MDKNITVLVVEDILSARETVIHILRALGFSQFCEAENGVQALEVLASNSVGLIISDWNMPQMNGLALLRKVRSLAETSHIPFVFLTSKSEVEDIALASDQGVSGYLVKPVTIKAMADALGKVFEQGFERDFELLRAEIRTLSASKDYARAHQIVAAFEALHPGQIFRIRLEKVLLFMEVGEYGQAEEQMCKILSANPLFSKGWATMAKLQSWQGKWDEALAAAQKAMTISPNNTDYYILCGSINLHKGEMYEARKFFMTALNIDRKNDQIKQDIWNTYVDMDMVDEVQRDFGTYIFSSLNCDTLNNMAVAYRRKGELGRAIEIYRAALAKEPDNPKILFNTAVAYVSRKQYAKARTLVLHALGNDPDFEKAKALLQQIEISMEHKKDDKSHSGREDVA